MSSLRSDAAAGAQWNAAGTLAGAVLNFVQLAVLAKLLSPEDFGLMAMVMVAIALAQKLADGGVGNVIIQRQDLSNRELSSLFWLAVGSGVVLWIAFLAAGPALVALYREPRLAGPVQLLAVVFVLSAPGLPMQLLLQKELRFKALALLETGTAALAACVAVVLALRGHGVFALVWGQLVLAAARSLALVGAGWRRFRPALHFRIGDLREHLRFGFYQIGERTLNFLGQRADQLLLGLLVGAEGLGYYTLAFNLAMQPVTRINPILTRVAFPVLARVQHSQAKLREGYIAVRRALTAVNAPAILGLAAVAPLAIPALLGEAWRPSVVLVQLLAVVALFRTTGNPVGPLLLACGRADLGFRWNAALFAVQLPVICAAAIAGGVTGVAAALVLLHVIFFSVEYVALIRPLLGPCLGDYLGSVLPAMGTAAAMALCVAAVPFLFEGRPWQLALGFQMLSGALIYTGLNLWLFRAQVREVLRLAVAGRA